MWIYINTHLDLHVENRRNKLEIFKAVKHKFNSCLKMFLFFVYCVLLIRCWKTTSNANAWPQLRTCFTVLFTTSFLDSNYCWGMMMDILSIYYIEHHLCFVIIYYVIYCFSHQMKRHLSAIVWTFFVVIIKPHVIPSMCVNFYLLEWNEKINFWYFICDSAEKLHFGANLISIKCEKY